jgi:propanediol dehydratase large subunit
VAGNVVTYKRSRLAPDFVEQLTIGSMNWKFLEELEDLESLTHEESGDAVEEERVFELDD